MDIFLDILLKPPQPFIGLFLSLVVVYRLNREMQVWVKTEDALRVVPVPDFLIVHVSEFWNHPNGW